MLPIRLAVITGLAMAACARPTTRVGTVSDSAGIQIVWNPTRSLAPETYHLSPTPRIDLGGLQETDVAAELTDARGHANLVLVSDGRRVIAIDDTVIEVFEPSGRMTRTVGRKGAGPGEFGHLSGICRTRGDTSIVSDEFQSRFGVLDSLGNVIRQVGIGSRKVLENACLDDGTVILTERAPTEDPRGWSRVRMIRVDLLGNLVDTLGDFPESTMFMSPDGQRGKYLHAVFAAGGRRFVWGDGQTPELRVYRLDPGFALVRLIRTDDPLGEPLGKGIQLNPGTDNRLHGDRSTHRHRMPIYEDVRLGEDGAIWLRDTVVRVSGDVRLPPLAGTWNRFDSTGKLSGRLILPDTAPFGDLRVMRFGTDEIVVSYTDREGARHLAVHGIVIRDRQAAGARRGP